MFDTDRWQEILSTISKNKLRTFLTGFSVFWSIFMLIFLLGAGKGFENGVHSKFEKNASNALWIHPRQTSLPYNGLKPGRYIQLTNDDYTYLKSAVTESKKMSTELYIKGWGGSPVTYGKLNGSYTIRGVNPEHKEIEFRKMSLGRFVNDKDILNFRKVAAIGATCMKELFNNENPIGKYIQINKIPFKVVGVFEEELEQNQRGRIYLPVSASQKIFAGSNKVDEIMLTTNDMPLEESKALAKKLKNMLAHRHQFDPNDPRAIYIRNNNEDAERFNKIFGGISAFIWLIGIGTVMGSIIGVGNIMTIIVKERTKEIGIRKALGATPYSVIALIIQESVVITSLFGYFGLLLGVFLIEASAKFIPSNDVFAKPEIDIQTAAYATVILVISGALAGLIPAYKAASIRPIVALRDE